MKQIVLILLIGLTSNLLFSQDIIIKKNGSEIKTKIIEITIETIKYKEFDFQEGPIRNINISDVFMVIYENGNREVFAKKEDNKWQVPISAKGFHPPSEGKAVIYFVRVTPYGALISFEYFHQDRYIGIFKGKNYMRYECDPGEQLLWASSENKEFITTNLEAGKTYIVMVDVLMGAWKARVGLRPISVKDEQDFVKAKRLINKKEPAVTSEEKIEEMNIRLKDFIAKKLQMYEEVWKLEKDFNHISSDMAIPAEAMK
ncbi:MAG: hypothetical protein K9H64_16440 [Bacteroidales bacterium]|nr:hypothetical protein [Bacteroidales bacterium]MCF8457559.1 hypothetical protein [Bacteroidales bacterium]